MDENDTTLAAYDTAFATYLRRTPAEPSAMARWLADLVGDVIDPGARVLEIGSAGGVDATLLREAGLEVQATDATPAFVHHLRTHGFPDAVRYDVRRDDPPPGPWDIVFANAALLHLTRADFEASLRRLHDALGDGTILMASVKAGDGEGWSREKLGIDRWYTYWRPAEFHAALGRAGWVVEESRTRSGRYDDWIAVVAVPERSALAQAFDERAATYGSGDFHREYAEALVATAPLRPGWRVLDVGAGTGFVSRAAARVLGPTGHVLAVDLSEGMLARVAAAPVEEGAAPIEPLWCDATRLPLPDGSVDAVLCGAGLLYMPVAPALREWQRVLRPGGVLAFSTMRAGEPPATQLFRLHTRAFGIELPDLSAPLGDPDAARATVAAAGFTDAEVIEGEVHLTDQDLDHAWDVHERMNRAHLSALPEEDRGRLRASYVAEVGLLARTDPRFTRGRTLYVVARRPG